ncbi:MAG: hypothetical protein SNJ77_07190 [Cytophagales bacterium]
MKTISLISLSILVWFGVQSCTSKTKEISKEQPVEFREDMLQELSLDEITKKKVLEIFESQKTELDSLKIAYRDLKKTAQNEDEKSNLRKQEKEAKEKIKEKYLTKLSAILTQEQIALLKSFKAKEGKMKDRKEVETPELKAQKKAEKYQDDLGLDDNQKQEVLKLALKYEKSKAEIKNKYPKEEGKEQSEKIKEARKSEEEIAKASFINGIKGVLNKEQLAKWNEKESQKSEKKTEEQKKEKKS